MCLQSPLSFEPCLQSPKDIIISAVIEEEEEVQPLSWY